MTMDHDHPLNTDTLGRNEDGSYDIILRMTVRLADEVSLRADMPGMLEFEHQQGVDSLPALITFALQQHLTGGSTELIRIEKGHVFGPNGSTGFFQNRSEPDEGPQ